MKVPLAPRAQVTREGGQGQLGGDSSSPQLLAHHGVLAGEHPWEMLVPNNPTG